MADFESRQSSLLQKYGISTNGGSNNTSSSPGSSGTGNFQQRETDILQKYGISTGTNQNSFQHREKELLQKYLMTGSDVSTFLTDANSYLNKIQSDFDSLDYSTADALFDAKKEEFLDLSKRGNNALNFIERNREALGPDAADQLTSQIKEFKDTLAKNFFQFQQAKQNYSNFDSEEAYQAAVKQSQWLEKYQNQGYQDLASALSQLEDGEEKEWLKSYSDSVDYEEKIKYNTTVGLEEIKTLENTMEEISKAQAIYDIYLENPLLALMDGDGMKATEEQIKELLQGYGSITEMEDAIRQKRQYTAQAQQIQEQIKQQEEFETWKENLRSPEEILPELEQVQEKVKQLEGTVKSSKRLQNQALADGIPGMDASEILNQQAQLKQMQEDLAQLEKEYYYSQQLQYTALTEKEDFEEKSKYVSTKKGDEIYDPFSGTYVDTGFQDIDYDYINRNPVAVGRQMLSDQKSGTYQAGTDQSYRQEMTDEEIKIYNYLYATDGKEKAQEYVDFLNSELTARQRSTNEAAVRELASMGIPGAAAASAISIGMSPLKGISYIGQGVNYLLGGKIDQNAGYNKFAYTTTAIRDQVAKEIEASGKWGKVGSFAYQTAMSMGDFLYNATFAGGSQALSLAIMGTGAAADATISAKDRGLNDDQAFTLGTVAGAAEVMTEIFSLDALLDVDMLRNGVMKYVLTNMLTEGSEEVASSLINLVADIVVAKDQSEWQESINRYQQEGYTEGEAFGMALAEQAASMGMDFLGGALSGGVMAGGNAVIQTRHTKSIGKALGDMDLSADDVQTFIDTGLESAPDTASYQIAKQMQQKLESGQKLSENDLSRLYQANVQAVDAEQAEAITQENEATVVQEKNQGMVQLANPGTRVSASDEIWKQAQRLATATGRNIIFYSAPATGSGIQNGYYQDGSIYVNTESESPLAQIVSHELTHSVEMADAYEELSQIVLQRIQSTGGNLQQMRQEKAELYARNGVMLNSEEDIDSEIVAEYVEKNLLMDVDSIEALTQESPNIARKILDWIDKLLAKLGNKDAQERTFLKNAKDIYAKALKQTPSSYSTETATVAEVGENGTVNKGLSKTEEMLQWLRENFAAGNLTEEEFDVLMDDIMQQEDLDGGMGAQEVKNSFAGVNAKNADLEALERAKEMQKKGAANESIRQETGWFQGMDGKWRWEIDDSGMTVDKSGDLRGSISYKWFLEDLENAREDLFGHADMGTLADVRAYNRAGINGDTEEQQRLYEKLISGNNAYFFGQYAEALDNARAMGEKYGNVLYSGGQLADYVDHETLYKAYPRLKETGFRFADLPSGTLGEFDATNNTIVLSDELADETEDVIIHEIQHLIQETEGFASGASPDYWEQRQRTESAIKRNDNEIEEQSRHAEEILNGLPENIAEQFRDWYNLDKQDEEAAMKVANKLNSGPYSEQFNDYFMTTWVLDNLQKYNYARGANELYRNTAGEIEARDAQSRRNMTAEERQASAPNLGNKDTVFADYNKVLYSLDQKYADLPSSFVDVAITADDMETAVQEVVAMEPVTQITGEEFAKGEKSIFTQVEEFFAQHNNVAHNAQLGDVILDRRGVKSDVAHGIGRKKAAAFAAVPEIIEHGRVIDYKTNWKNRGYDTAVVAAPVMIGDEVYIAGVIMTRSNRTNRFYLHEVMAIKNGAMPFKTGTRNTGTPGGDAPSLLSILDRIRAVKQQSEKTSETRKQYSITATKSKRDVVQDLKAILDRGGDTEELRRYVDGMQQNIAITEENSSGVQQILRSARQQGQSVEEYLRWNWEQYEQDGQWNQEAREALDLERKAGRQYSVSNDQSTETTESQTFEISRNNLPTKARDYLNRAERKLVNDIGNKLSVPSLARRDYLQPIVQQISDEYLSTGTVSDATVDSLFDRAYAEGIVADAEFYKQYKDIKKHLQTTSVTLSEQDRSDIADFNDFRRRAFGTLRIVNQGGVPVDVAYDELRSMVPELFPEDITHPADQLQRMYEVGQSIRVSEKSLDDYYGQERDTFMSWAKNDFQAAIGDTIRELRDVKRYAENQATEQEERRVLSTEEAEKTYQDLKKARRNVEKVRAKNLLTDTDEKLLGRMLKGEIGEQHLDPNTDNVKGIMAVYKAKQEYESISEMLREYKRSIRATRLQEADEYLETANDWKDKKAGILYARETMRRNILDIVPDKQLAGRVAENYFESVHVSEAKATRFKTEYRDRVRELNLSTKIDKGNLVSEAHAVQLLGEAMDNIRVMENAKGRMRMRDSKTLEEWRNVVNNLWMENKELDKKKIENAVAEFRKIYDELFQQMNRVRVENGYEPINYRQGYFPHFQPGSGDGIIAHFGKAMGIDTQVDALPTAINGLTHTFKPGIQWFGNAQERLGFNTAYDAVEGFDKYIEGVASVIYQTENIQKLRALATQARYRTSDEGIRKQVDAVRMDDRLTDEEKQSKINEIFEKGKYTLSNFVAELDEYTNLLANKKSKYDRTMESMLGRRAYTMMKAWESRVGANMIAGNISSAVTNFIPLTQAGAQLDRGMILRGMWGTLANMKQSDSFVGMSDFLTNRRGSDPLVQTWMQKVSAKTGIVMDLIDNFTSESIVRAAYMQNLNRGMSEAEAMHQADIFAAGVMADRSKGSMPTLFESRNPLFKAFTQFQLEVNNQFSEIFKDLPRAYKDKGLKTLGMVLLKYFLGAWLYNELFEKLLGRRPALDPIGMLLDAKDTYIEDGFGAAISELASEALGELPFSAGLTLVGVETDGGRLPAASAVPDLSAIWEASTEKDLTEEQRWKMIQDELSKLAYVVPPFGGAQASKIWKGIDAYIKGGSYSLDSSGREILQYPVYKDDPYTALGNALRLAVFGKSSLPESQEWVESGYDSLNYKETAVYQDLLEVGIKDQTAFNLIKEISNVDETESGAKKAAQKKLLFDSDISNEGKAIIYYGMVAAEKEREWMNTLADAGADQGETLDFVVDLYDAQSLSGTSKKAAQYEIISSVSLTEEEKKIAVGFILGTDLTNENGNPTQYGKFLTAVETGLSVDGYLKMRCDEVSVDSYFELTDVGINAEDAADLATALDSLEPYEGKTSVSWIQQCETILESELSENDKMAALSTAMTESTYEKVMIGNSVGMSVESYVELKKIMPDFDEDGNGSYTQTETKNAIDSLSGDNNVLYALIGDTPSGISLSNTEKAILWQLQNKSWKPKANPYDTDVGKMVYDLMYADGAASTEETEQQTTDDLMKLLLGLQ